MKRELTILAIMLLSVSMVFALTNQNTDATLTIQNRNPTIISVTSVIAQDPTENSVTPVEVNFTAEDLDGNENLNFTTAFMAFTKLSESTRSSSCSNVTAVNENATDFTCSINMQYYDAAGLWTINASIKDINNVVAYNDTTDFTYNSLKAFVMSPSSISFGTLNLGQSDVEASSETTLNNTGNTAITSGNIDVTGYSLYGQSDASKTIWVGQFNVYTATGTPNSGNSLITATPVGVTGATLPRGAPGANQEDLFWYVDVPSTGLTAQQYATTGHTAWSISIT